MKKKLPGGQPGSGSREKNVTRTKRVRLSIIEKEEIYRCAYELLPKRGPIELLGVEADCAMSSFEHIVSTYRPEVLMLGEDRPEPEIIHELERIRLNYPNIGMVFSFLSYSYRDMELLRGLASKSEGGVAVFLKQSLTEIEQIIRIILAVAYGQTIIDPALTSLMFAGKPRHPILERLTSREAEILTLVSEGYTNAAIARALYIDIKTVENHLNSLYAKLRENGDFNDRHLRVTATRLCLRETEGLRL